MRHYFLLALLLLSLAPFSFSQMRSANYSPAMTPAPPSKSEREFGYSRKKDNRKHRSDAEEKAKSLDPDEAEVVRVETNLVVNDVLVTNQKGNLILGLEKDDFVVKEDSVPQKVETFHFGEGTALPRSVVLLIDCGAPQWPYLKKSVEAAKLLVDKLHSNDRMAIATTDMRLRIDFTQDKTQLRKALDSIGEPCNLNIEFDTLLAILNEKFEEEGNRQRIVIFQGDGTEVIWLKQDKDTPYQVSYATLERSGLRYRRDDGLGNFGFGDVKEGIEKSRASVYSIIVGGRFLGLSKDEQLEKARIKLAENVRFRGGKEKDIPAIIRQYQHARVEANIAGQTAMVQVAELSGGFADFIERPEDAEDIYANVFTVIKNRYLIGYYPTDRRRDGRRREVKIEVRGHPEYTVRGLKAYSLSQ